MKYAAPVLEVTNKIDEIHCTGSCGSSVWVQVTLRHNDNNLFNKSTVFTNLSGHTKLLFTPK
jgi:hypothetical protein